MKVPPQIPIVRPALGEEEIEAVARVIRSGWVTQGPEVAAFEADFARAVGAPHAVAVANGTVAIELALRVLGVGRGDRVATVSHSFIATANAVVAVGATPVFVDVEEDNWGMDPRALAAVVAGCKAVLCVHQLGMPCDIREILRVAGDVPVVEDAACAIGSAVDGERIGKPHGVIATFSFHPRKVVTTGDGGMLTTRDAALAARMRLLRQHAMSVPDTIRHHATTVVFEQFLEPAFNFRMTDVQAAIGRTQLARLDAIVAERRRLAAGYASLPGAPTERAGVASNWQSYPLRVTDQVGVLQRLMDAGVGAKRGCANAHQEPAYADVKVSLPVSERLRDTTIVLPLFHGMTAEEQRYVVDAVRGLSA